MIVETEESFQKDRDRTLRLLGEVLDRVGDKQPDLSDEDLEPVSRKTVESIHERKVFVGGLPFRADSDAVEDFFEKFGEIDSFNMPVDTNTGKGKGIAFIVYAQKAGLQRALLHDGGNYNGQRLRVKQADPDARGKGVAVDAWSKTQASGTPTAASMPSRGKGVAVDSWSKTQASGTPTAASMPGRGSRLSKSSRDRVHDKQETKRFASALAKPADPIVGRKGKQAKHKRKAETIGNVLHNKDTEPKRKRKAETAGSTVGGKDKRLKDKRKAQT